MLEHADAERAAFLQRFFKTAPGQYGAGDRFLGLTVPVVRKAVREFRDLTLEDVAAVLASPWHEERLLALLLLVDRYGSAGEEMREGIYRLYLRSTGRINGWDLVDASAPHIVGVHLQDRDRRVLRRLARSPLLWDRRIAMMATLHFIRRGEFADALQVAEILVNDGEDLIHKAVGWMLREIGKRDRLAEERFLSRFATSMPRTMLRYAVERFPPALRRRYMAARQAQ